MCPPSDEQRPVERHLRDALEAAERSQTKYYIREALQMTQIDE